MNDILPPKKRPLSQPPQLSGRPSVAPAETSSVVPPQASSPAELTPAQPLLPLSRPRRFKKVLLWVLAAIIGLGILAVLSAYMWYTSALQPVDSAKNEKTRIQIVQGSSPSDIGNLLEEKKLIRSSLAFDIYTRLSGKRTQLQAGEYSLSPSESTQQIVAHLLSGNVDQFSITFLPGATLAENRTQLIKAGYSADEVNSALAKQYNHPLFASKPAGSDLEGYIYGETYTFAVSATVEDVLKHTFDEFYAKLQQKNLIPQFEKQNLNLYQAITLASIIQREVPSAVDQKQVAQIFFTRLEVGMELGSDVTYQYAAKKLGVTPSPSLESPYNTRKYAGLPPGPIATPGLTALEAVADPASGEYVYFLSGDDDKTYYGRTFAEHEANISNHCKVKCLLP